MGASALTATLVTAFQRAETLLALCRQGSLRQPLNHSLHAVAIERLKRAPAQTRLAQQLLHRFVQILLCGKPRIMRGNGPDQPRQRGFFNRLRLFDPVLQEPCRFRGLLVVRRCIADNQTSG